MSDSKVLNQMTLNLTHGQTHTILVKCQQFSRYNSIFLVRKLETNFSQLHRPY
jgi:hypothetical protein